MRFAICRSTQGRCRIRQLVVKTGRKGSTRFVSPAPSSSNPQLETAPSPLPSDRRAAAGLSARPRVVQQIDQQRSSLNRDRAIAMSGPSRSAAVAASPRRHGDATSAATGTASSAAPAAGEARVCGGEAAQKSERAADDGKPRFISSRHRRNLIAAD